MKIEPAIAPCEATSVPAGALFVVADGASTYLALRTAGSNWHHLALTGSRAFKLTAHTSGTAYQFAEEPVLQLDLRTPSPVKNLITGAVRLETSGQLSIVAEAGPAGRSNSDTVAVSIVGGNLEDDLKVAPQFEHWRIGVPSLGEILWLLQHDSTSALVAPK